MELNLKGKTAIVTGGARGLGRAICRSLASEGVHVAVNCRKPQCKDRPIDEVAELVQELKRTYGVNAVAACGDVSNSEDVNEIFNLVFSELGEVDILVNNAAIRPVALIKNVSEEQWNKTLSVNLTGAFLMSRQIVRNWLEQNRPGTIINIVSQAAFRGSKTGSSHYAVSKAGLVSLTVSLAGELASKDIRVNAVAPGLMETDMTADLFETGLADYLKRIPISRIADPKEVADVVTFLASDRASYITGATIDVSGGMLMR
ncbi:MAG: SDR family NAD(P)-dependent oxidoreductase [Planctomycetota bacterium]